MNNEYIEPALSVIEVEVMNMLAASEIKFSDGHADTELSNGRRGAWIDLWD